VGYKILCAVPTVTDTFENSSIVKAGAFMKQEEHATTVLFVMKVGPDAYADKAKFPNGPWCKEGDFVLVRTYSGTRFKVYGKEFRSINDDMVEMTVQDPRGITRA
jgi:co-chaperonin GroES (HSP10)